MKTDQALQPRITEIPKVSDHALSIFRKSLVWDNTLPWVPGYNIDEIDNLLPRFQQVGVNFTSLTLAGGAGINASVDTVIRRIGKVRAEIIQRQNSLVLAESLADIRQAKEDNKLAVNFNFQETLPFDNSLEMIQVYYDLGVRQALLAYNQKNLVGDGCAEITDAGLSRFGVEVVKEMNRVGMLVDGSHSGYRTTMDAMDICEGPFIFSHSNPHSVHAHYRNIKDDQIKACAASGGVMGINGVGGFVGDVNARTESIFRCLDYTVELVGPEFVGIGLDYVEDVEGAYQRRKRSTLAWPSDGKEIVRHNFAGPEQLISLVQIMVDHGYSESAVIGILGENWCRVAQQVWR